MKKRLLSLLLLLALLAALPTAACAEAVSAVRAEDVIYLGVFQGEPVAWLVLDSEQTNMGTPGLFLLSRGLLDYHNVRFDESSTLWEGSDAQQWCYDFAASAFSAAESAVVLPTEKVDEKIFLYGLDWRSMALTGEQVFFLSVHELAQYFGSYNKYEKHTVRRSSLESYYWLRTPHFSHDDYHSIVLQDNLIHDYLPDARWSARPCLNLDVQSVLFLLPADDTGEPGSVAVPEAEEGTVREWKLLLADESLPFRAETVEADEESITVHYSGADTGEGVMLSLLIRDAEGRPLSLTRLERPSAPEGRLTLRRAELALPEGATLWLLCEQARGELLSSTAGLPQALETA